MWSADGDEYPTFKLGYTYREWNPRWGVMQRHADVGLYTAASYQRAVACLTRFANFDGRTVLSVWKED
jgi:hypothetical protein